MKNTTRRIWRRRAGYILIGFLLASIGVGGFFRREIFRLYKVVFLFEPAVIAQNFRSMSEFFPHHSVSRGGAVYEFEFAPRPLPTTYRYAGEERGVMDLLTRTSTTGLLVLKNDSIAYEKYWNGHTPESLHISWSVGKSFVSALFGIAITEGFIASIEDPVTKYVPELKGTGYNGVRIKDVLQMSSGVGFNEDYGDFNSDINRMGRVIALGDSIGSFVASLKNERPPGTYHHYVSMDTQVLGMIIRNATGKPLAQYLSEKIWSRIGMQSDATWIVDDTGMELAFGTLNATLRDYARFGRLCLRNGNWNGEQIVPAAWIRESITPDAPHLQPGENPASSNRLGYGYQWWIPEHRDGNDYSAIGVYGQFIYVNPARSVVIVKNSSFADYTSVPDNEMETLEMLQAIARGI